MNSMNGNIPKFEEILASSAHGKGGARTTSKNVSAPPSAEKIRAVQQSLLRKSLWERVEPTRLRN